MTRDFIGGILAAAVIVMVAAAFLWVQPVRAAECRTVSVSWYGHQHHGRKTASGVRFNQWGISAAMVGRQHLGEVWTLTYRGKTVRVPVTDTGNFAKYGRFMDLSRGAFNKLTHEDAGVLRGVRACRVR